MTAKKERTLDPKLDLAINSLRIAGVPERRTYERLREIMKNPPSYRDIRAAYARGGVTTRHDAAVKRKMGARETVTDAEGHRRSRVVATGFPRFPEGSQVVFSRYIAETKANAKLAADPKTRADLQKITDTKFIHGYLARAYDLRHGNGYDQLVAILNPDNSAFLQSVESGFEHLKT